MNELFKELEEKFRKSKPSGRIRFLRKDKELTIKEMAEKCFTTEKTVSDWESGKAVPRRGNQKRIAIVLGVNKDVIFGEI